MKQARKLYAAAIQNGINFIDSAFIYGMGRSEELIGEVLKEFNTRQDMIIATKGAHKIEDGKGYCR